VSALTGEGIGEFAMEVDNFIAIMKKSSDFLKNVVSRISPGCGHLLWRVLRIIFSIMRL